MRKNLLISIMLIAVTVSLSAAQTDTSKENFKPIVEEAWKAINETFYDATFKGNKWAQVRKELLGNEYNSKQAAYAAIQLMLKRLDEPATRFLTEEQFAALLKDFSGESHSGVGLLELLSIDLNERTRKITVVTPMPDSPAARAGLKPGDEIEVINGVPTAQISLAEATALLRGEKDTSVKLIVQRGSRKLKINLKREIIPALAVRSLIREYRGSKIGYIALSQFTASSGQEMRDAVAEMEKNGVDVFVLDLRNNPGGAVTAFQEIAGIFLGQKVAGFIRGRENKETALTSQGQSLTDKPLAVLVNRGSASAAEALAGALQSHHRATTVGEKTFGKGLVHFPRQLSDGSALIVTAGRLRTPTGWDILDEHIEPDVKVESAESPALTPSRGIVATLRDPQYLRAVNLLLEQSMSKK